MSSIDIHPTYHSLYCQSSAMEGCVDQYMKLLQWFYASGYSHAENATGYRERMPSISSLENISPPWRYRWQKKLLVMCISPTSGHLTW